MSDSTPTEGEFTLDQLAQLSLGGTAFGQTNISILHTIVNLALKKLSCENEKIVITGAAAEKLKELFKKSNYTPTLVFIDDDFPTPLKNLDAKIADLTEKIDIIEKQFDDHLVEGRLVDPCHETEEHDPIISELIRDDWFLRHFKDRINRVFVCRLNRLRYNINNLEHLIIKFQMKCMQAHVKLITIDELKFKYYDLNERISNYQADFKKSLYEIQYLLDQKADNRDIPILKKRIKDIIDFAAETAKNVVDMKTRPRALLSCVEVDSDGTWKNKKGKPITLRATHVACDCEKDPTGKRNPNPTNPICDCTASPAEKLPLVERIKATHYENNVCRLTWTGSTIGKQTAIKD